MPSSGIQLFGGQLGFFQPGYAQFSTSSPPLLLHRTKIFSDTNACTVRTDGYAPVI